MIWHISEPALDPLATNMSIFIRWTGESILIILKEYFRIIRIYLWLLSFNIKKLQTPFFTLNCTRYIASKVSFLNNFF